MTSEKCSRCGRERAATYQAWRKGPHLCGRHLDQSPLVPSEFARDCDRATIARLERENAELRTKIEGMGSDRDELLEKLNDAKWSLLP